MVTLCLPPEKYLIGEEFKLTDKNIRREHKKVAWIKLCVKTEGAVIQFFSTVKNKTQHSLVMVIKHINVAKRKLKKNRRETKVHF